MMAHRELSKFEQDTLVEALTQIDAAHKARKLAEHEAAIEKERAGREAAEQRVGELTAELAKRGDAYRTALADLERKLMQERESRSTADTLAAQARAEADGERSKHEEILGVVNQLRQDMAEMMTMERAEAAEDATEDAPLPSYRINVVGRDAAGDLKTLEIVPVERK